MPIITDIKPQAKNKGRVSLFIDDRFYCGLEKITALAFRLTVGQEIDPDRLTAAVCDSERASAFERAAKYLGARPRTKKEMADYLTGKGYTADTVDDTVRKLEEYGYIDDRAYCRLYVEEYKRKAGARKLAYDLQQKGVARSVVDQVLETLDDEQTAADVAALARKYLRSHAYDKRKLTAYLLGKGFAYDAVKAGLEQLGADGEDEFFE